MYRAARAAWGLVAVGAATAVGVTTRNPGFVAITFIGALVLPRVLGLTPGGWRHGYGRHGMGWHGGCAGAPRADADAKPVTQTPQPV